MSDHKTIDFKKKRRDMESVDGKLRTALIEEGLLIPVTEDEVMLAKETFDEDDVVLPPRLRDTNAVFLEITNSDINDERHAGRWGFHSQFANTNLARAARDGKKIPKEIEEKMRRNRKAAETKFDEKQKN